MKHFKIEGILEIPEETVEEFFKLCSKLMETVKGAVVIADGASYTAEITSNSAVVEMSAPDGAVKVSIKEA